jgi:hypothetical protein
MSFNAPTYGGLANVTTVLVVATSPTSLYPPLMGIAVWPSSSFYFDSAQATIDGNGNLTVEGFAHAS